MFGCFACYEVLYKPVTLNCSHNACLPCLKKAVENDHLECWMCRDKFDRDTLEENVNESCYQALRKAIPGYDVVKLRAEGNKERKDKNKKAKGKVRRSTRQNDDNGSDVEESNADHQESRPRGTRSRPGRKVTANCSKKNDLSSDED